MNEDQLRAKVLALFHSLVSSWANDLRGEVTSIQDQVNRQLDALQERMAKYEENIDETKIVGFVGEMSKSGDGGAQNEGISLVHQSMVRLDQGSSLTDVLTCGVFVYELFCPSADRAEVGEVDASCLTNSVIASTNHTVRHRIHRSIGSHHEPAGRSLDRGGRHDGCIVAKPVAGTSTPPSTNLTQEVTGVERHVEHVVAERVVVVVRVALPCSPHPFTDALDGYGFTGVDVGKFGAYDSSTISGS